MSTIKTENSVAFRTNLLVLAGSVERSLFFSLHESDMHCSHLVVLPLQMMGWRRTNRRRRGSSKMSTCSSHTGAKFVADECPCVFMC